MIIGIAVGVLIVVSIVIGMVRRRKKQYDLEAVVARKRMQDELAKEQTEFLNRNAEIQHHMNEGANSPWNLPPGL